MKTIHFDCFSGISGDMTLGALLDLGIDRDIFIKELSKLNIDGYEITIEKTCKHDIYGTDFDVILNENHHHHQEDYHHHRNLQDIEIIIENSELSHKVKGLSKNIFRTLAEAEARVHGKDINEIHFHEVGAIDSIVDIVGTAICIEILGIERFTCSYVYDGSGYTECAHGKIPVPVPAVVQLFSHSGAVLRCKDINYELVTPTGAAILTTLVEKFGSTSGMSILKVGYGFGKREIGEVNYLRVLMGESEDQINKKSNYSDGSSSSAYEEREITVIETNIDNMSGEVAGFISWKLLDSGALDVYYTPIFMKKNRPGILLTVITKKHDVNMIADIILNETTTLGMRISNTSSVFLKREIRSVETEYGEVRIKVSKTPKGTEKVSLEYEDIAAIARNNNLPLREIHESILNEVLRKDFKDI